MPAKNLFHDAVVHSLQADGWNVTDDPLVIAYGGRNLFVDLGAEQSTIGAEREGRQIAVEIQTFGGSSPIHDLQQAVGQIEIYRSVLEVSDPQRVLYLAVSRDVFDGIFSEPLGQLLRSSLKLKFLVFDKLLERIVQWIA